MAPGKDPNFKAYHDENWMAKYTAEERREIYKQKKGAAKAKQTFQKLRSKRKRK